MPRRLIVQLTTDDPETVATALTVGMTAAAAGAEVGVWLSGPATAFALVDGSPGTTLEYAPDPEQALAAVTSVSVCSQCAARRGLTEADLRPGARIAGATTLVEQLLAEGTQALTY
jgi:predicted peroxiredoxin